MRFTLLHLIVMMAVLGVFSVTTLGWLHIGRVLPADETGIRPFITYHIAD